MSGLKFPSKDITIEVFYDCQMNRNIDLSFKPSLKSSITNPLDRLLTFFRAIVTRLKKKKSLQRQQFSR